MKKMENMKTLDMTLLLAEAIAVNSKAYKMVDKVVEKNKDDFMEFISKNSIWRNNVVCSDGSIEKEEYFLKAMVLINNAKYETQLLEVLKRGYSDSYNYVNSVTKFEFMKFAKKIFNKFNKLGVIPFPSRRQVVDVSPFYFLIFFIKSIYKIIQ